MALPTYHCLECDKDFKAGDWDCVPGEAHRVEPKDYYMDDAPTVVQYDALNNRHPYIDKRASRCLVLNIPPDRKVQDGDEVRVIPGGSVEFVRGFYRTANPVEQFWLDRKKGLVTKERWEDVYFNDDEKLQKERLKVQADQRRLQNERNELLEKVRAMEGKPERKKPGPKPKILVENPV